MIDNDNELRDAEDSLAIMVQALVTMRATKAGIPDENERVLELMDTMDDLGETMADIIYTAIEDYLRKRRNRRIRNALIVGYFAVGIAVLVIRNRKSKKK